MLILSQVICVNADQLGQGVQVGSGAFVSAIWEHLLHVCPTSTSEFITMLASGGHIFVSNITRNTYGGSPEWPLQPYCTIFVKLNPKALNFFAFIYYLKK